MLTFERANELFHYEPSSGKLFWRERRNSKIPDSLEARSVDKRYKYMRVNVGGKLYMVHRVIMVLMGRTLGTHDFVDHIDHDRQNNRWDNLRVVNKKDNTRNLSMYKKNKSGVTGVYQHTDSHRFLAYIRVNYRKIHLGSFKTLEEAAQARKEAEIKYGFHKNHGL